MFEPPHSSPQSLLSDPVVDEVVTVEVELELEVPPSPPVQAVAAPVEMMIAGRRMAVLSPSAHGSSTPQASA
jgi:hypothetical protein